MKAASPLTRHVHTFFHEYLIAQRSVSPNTVLSYRDTLKLFFLFAAKKVGRPVVRLELQDLDVELVLRFLEHLEKVRGNSTATRNARLAALHMFYEHVASRSPDELQLCQRVRGIPMKRAAQPEVRYLEVNELEALLSAIDRSTRDGRRDYALVAFTYQSGARVQEVIQLRACDLQLEPPLQVRIWGKGRKERIVPLWQRTATLLRRLLGEREVDSRGTVPVFVNHRGEPLSRWGVRYILAKHAAVASKRCSTIATKRVHPHLLRHTMAMHMLQAGADSSAIRDTLGHASAETTFRYARLNLEMKRKAMDACGRVGPRLKRASIPVWRRDVDLLAQLEALSSKE